MPEKIRRDFQFQPTLPARGATLIHQNNNTLFSISTHAPRTGSDGIWSENVPMALNFNPRSPHGERRVGIPSCNVDKKISTHAPRTGSDLLPLLLHWKKSISTHAPRTGSDLFRDPSRTYRKVFQPTLPARGATEIRHRRLYANVSFQPTLPARGATAITFEAILCDFPISTHAPRTGSDLPSGR